MTPSDRIVYGCDSVWKDKMVSYDGQTITYDAIGNPLSYRGMTFTWEKARELGSVTKDGNTYEYCYDQGGIRNRKEYELEYLYDSAGNILSLVYNGVEYYYVKNLQGDIVGIIDESGTQAVTYTYDSWGKVTEVGGSNQTLGNLNPFRYRGYYYDAETGLYYLNSRYYDPEVCRFISADTTDILGASLSFYDKNIYAYCDNNPIIRLDVTGKVWETVFDVASLGVSVVEVAINPSDPWKWAGLVGDAIDLVPFVTGIGEITRAIKSTKKLVDKSEDVVKVAKKLKKTVGNKTGTYEILYKSGKNYVGKGSFNRAIQSAVKHTKKSSMNNNLGDVVTAIYWKATKNPKMAFIEEYALQTRRGVGNPYVTYNKIWSPGKKYYLSMKGK